MKKFLALLFLFAVIFAANGQEIVRQGNRYIFAFYYEQSGLSPFNFHFSTFNLIVSY